MPDKDLSIPEVEHVARLARLGLTAEEVSRLREQLRAILAHIDALNRADTSQVPATAHPFDAVNVMRADELKASLSAEAALRNAHSAENGYFKVKAIQE